MHGASTNRPRSRRSEYIEKHGFGEYGKWHLGINDERPDDTKGHYEFPYGDFEKVHRCGVLTAESRAEQYKHHDIGTAAAHLHGMLDAPGGVATADRRRPTRAMTAVIRARGSARW